MSNKFYMITKKFPPIVHLRYKIILPYFILTLKANMTDNMQNASLGIKYNKKHSQ